MCSYNVRYLATYSSIISVLLSLVHGVDRFASPATSYAGSRSSQITVPNFNPIVDDYKNLRKSSPPYGSATAAPLLHKAQYASSSYSSNQAPHHDIIPIIKHSSEPNNGDGSYSFSYETANGISASEYSVYKPGLTNEEGVQSATGSFSYTGPDNVVYTITYTAGVEGFVPQGAHIPTPPPVPEAIQKVLQLTGENSAKFDESNSLARQYTSAIPIPYANFNSANYNKILPLRTSGGNEYKVQDEYTQNNQI